MAGWCHQCNGHELGQASGDGEEQGGLVCCSPWGHKDLYLTGGLNNKNRKLKHGWMIELERKDIKYGTRS